MGLIPWFYENHPNPASCLSLLYCIKCLSSGLLVITQLWDTAEEKEATRVSPVYGSSPAFSSVPSTSALCVPDNSGQQGHPATRRIVNRSKIKELAETTRPDCRHMQLRLNLARISKRARDPEHWVVSTHTQPDVSDGRTLDNGVQYVILNLPSFKAPFPISLQIDVSEIMSRWYFD